VYGYVVDKHFSILFVCIFMVIRGLRFVAVCARETVAFL